MFPLLLDEQCLFDSIRDYWDTHSYSPSVRELETATGERSRSKLQSRLKSLQQKGYIDWEQGQPRTYQVLVRGIPVLGAIQAGLVVEHPTDMVERVDLPGVPYRSELYALKVCGDSMIDAHICEGDLVVIRPNPDLWALRRDAIAVVWVEGGGATLKYVEFDGELVHLKPANPAYAVLKVSPEEIELKGVVVSVHRNYNSCYSDHRC